MRAGGGARFVFRVDAGPDVGLGHLARCLVLADAARAAGAETTFLTRTPDDVRGRTRGHALRVLEARSTAEDAAQTAEAARDVVLVLDGYGYGAEHAAALAAEGARARPLWIDDGGFVGARPGVVLNHNLYATAALYPDMVTARVLAGPEYALVREDVVAARAAMPARADAPGGARARLVVTMGGSDPPDATSLALDAIARVRALRPLDARVVVGPSNPRRAALASAPDVVVDPPNLPALFAWADVALTAGGGTCMELACLGVPIVALALSANQEPVVAELVRRDLGRDGGPLGTLDGARLADLVTRTLGDHGWRARVRERQRTTVDGQGGARVIETLLGSSP
jgi:spore coat polysaccharide biosynthesis predicted glycosyltransferase SpsG